MKWALVIIALLILAGCAAPEESEAKKLAEKLKEEAEQPAAPVQTPETQAQPTPEPTAVAIPTEIPEPTAVAIPIEIPKPITQDVEETVAQPQERTEIYAFLDKFVQKVTGYQFSYKQDKYYVRGTKYKVELFRPVTQKSVTFGELKKTLFYYDTVYVDRATKKAVAYCEGHQSYLNTQCAQLEIYDLAYPVPFADYNMTLPEDWLLAYVNQEPTVLEEDKYYVNQKSVTRATFEGENTTAELNFDPVTGLVIRADLKSGGQFGRYDYEDLAANLVRDIDVMHRSKNEIPSSETFNANLN